MSYLKLVQNLSSNAESDECYTPSDQVIPFLKLLDKEKTYYEATSGKSNQLIDGFRCRGYNIVSSNDKDFFECTSNDVFDGVITNPPYSKKDAFIEHCYKLGKPFALFLPVSALQGNKRGQLFMQKGMSIMVYNNRVDFTGKGSPHFGNAWFHWGFTEPNTIEWVNNPKIKR